MTAIGCLVASWFSSISPALADNYKEALEQITTTAERICATAPLKSSSNELELSGQAKADVKGLISKVADLGIAGAAKYKTAESEGVLQKDLAPLLSKSADCKERVFDKLFDKLIAPGNSSRAPPQSKSAPHNGAAAPKYQQNNSGGTNYQGDMYFFLGAMPPGVKPIEARPVKDNGDGTYTLSNLIQMTGDSVPRNILVRARGEGVTGMTVTVAAAPGAAFGSGSKGAGFEGRGQDGWFYSKFASPVGYYSIDVTTTKPDQKPDVQVGLNVD